MDSPILLHFLSCFLSKSPSISIILGAAETWNHAAQFALYVIQVSSESVTAVVERLPFHTLKMLGRNTWVC